MCKTKAYLGLCQKSRIALFSKIVSEAFGEKPFPILAKTFTMDV